MTVGEVRMDGNMHTFILVKRVVNVSRTPTATARSALQVPLYANACHVAGMGVHSKTITAFLVNIY